MSNTKTVMSQAANTQGIPLDITDVFSTYLYTGTGSTQTITNDIDLAGEGGMVWLKTRNSNTNHWLADSERGVGFYLQSNDTDANIAVSNIVTSFNSNGFTLGSNPQTNNISVPNASWTFRKAPKFFDVVTYTGDGTAGREIAHNLGTTVGTIIVKKTDSALGWAVYHKDTGNTKILLLNDSGTGFTNAAYWDNTSPTDTNFTVGASSYVNGTGATYVAYLFAHNDGDGEFGPSGDQDIIKCGSFTTDGSGLGSVTLGFEPQWLMVKNADNIGSWVMMDTMRGMSNTGSKGLFANLSNAESNYTSANLVPTATGFDLVSNLFNANDNLIYIAIRRGPLAPPESATEVFAIDTQDATAPSFDSGFPVDMAFNKDVTATFSAQPTVTSRLIQGKYLTTSQTNAEASISSRDYDYMTGFANLGSNPNEYAWMWKRAPSFFDVVAYTGNGTTGRTVSHNLGVAPEMMWVKSRTDTRAWTIYHSALGNESLVRFDTGAAVPNSSVYWNSTDPASDVFTCGSNTTINGSGRNYIAYLFATLAGVSKVFSVTKSSGSDASVDCGFTSGPRFVMLKRTDSTGDWYVWDTERGIVAGNDPYLLLNSTAAEVTSTDYIDPTSNGFTIVNGGLADGDYIGYAVA